MIKFTIVRRNLEEEIYEVVADSTALTLAKAGEGLNESSIVNPGSYLVQNMSAGFERLKKD